MIMLRATAALCLIASVAAPGLTASAAEQVDPRDQIRKDWFQSLKRPENPSWTCCDASDCTRTKADWKGGLWYATVNGVDNTPIPPDKVLKEPKSIDGEAYVCASPSTNQIFCFVPPNPGY